MQEGEDSEELLKHTVGAFKERPRTHARFGHKDDTKTDHAGQCASSEGNSQELPEIHAKICVFSHLFRPIYSRVSSLSDSQKSLVIDAEFYEFCR